MIAAALLASTIAPRKHLTRFRLELSAHGVEHSATLGVAVGHVYQRTRVVFKVPQVAVSEPN